MIFTLETPCCVHLSANCTDFSFKETIHVAATATAAAAPSATATATAATAPSLWTTKCQLSTQPKCHSIILICLQATPVYSTITFFTARATVNCGTIIHQLSVVGPAPILSAVPKYHSTILCQLSPTPTATPLNIAKPVTTISCNISPTSTATLLPTVVWCYSNILK